MVDADPDMNRMNASVVSAGVFRSVAIYYRAHMHCDVDLRSRRMWAASYRLTRLVMNESSELLES